MAEIEFFSKDRGEVLMWMLTSSGTTSGNIQWRNRNIVRRFVNPPQRWKTPILDCVKVNFDGALRLSKNKGGIGIVIRNNNGEVMRAKAANVFLVDNAFMVEVMAMIDALIFVREMGFTDVVVEEDALSVIKKMQKLEVDFSPIGNFIEEAKMMLPMLNSICFTHIGREGNKVANYLAVYGLNVGRESIWVEDCPIFVKGLIVVDIALAYE